MFSKWLADIIIRNSNWSEKDKVIAKYGLVKIFAILEDLIFTILIGSLFGIMWESIIFHISFMSLRMYAGGCHSRTELRCKIHSALLTIVSIISIKWIPGGNEVSYLVILIISIIIVFISPVESKNKPLSKKEKEINQKKTMFVLVFLNMSAIIALFFKKNLGVKIFMVVVCEVCILMTVGKVENRKEK